ncbi:TPA: hypothetical protein ACH3X1_010285 [Trebouxia sp. C0004]
MLIGLMGYCHMHFVAETLRFRSRYLMRRSLQKILGAQLLVNASKQPTVAFIQPVQAGVIQKPSALCLQRHNFTASSSVCFAAEGVELSQSPSKRTQHSRRRHARKAINVPTSEPPAKRFDTPSLDRSVRSSTVNDQCQIWNETQHRIRASSIPHYAFSLLIKLRLAGHDVFVVGGTVRDLLLNQVPSDVDLTTSASLVQVQQLAGRCQIVGKRSPVALVHMSNGRIIDVTSLEAMGSHNVAALAKRSSQGRLQAEHVDQSWTLPWHQNMQSRDFTVNALMYDPFSHLLFDYVGGMQDCQKRRLRCIKEPAVSFAEDYVRMLRAVRLSMRTGLHISKETMAAMRQQAHQLLRVHPSRLYLETSRMFSCGTCVKSVLLLWQLHLLDEILPTHASYLRLHKISRTQTLSYDSMTQRPLLLRLLHSLDAQASVDKPASMDVVVAVLVLPILVQAITAHKAELQAILLGASPHTFLQRPRKKAQTSTRSTTTALGSATSAEIMDDALQQWQARMGEDDAASYSQRLQEMLACLTVAAMKVTRSKAAVGLLPRGNVIVAPRLLIAFWHTVLPAPKVWLYGFQVLCSLTLTHFA